MNRWAGVALIIAFAAINAGPASALAGEVPGATLTTNPRQKDIGNLLSLGYVRVEAAGDVAMDIRSKASVDGFRFRPFRVGIEVGGGGYGRAALLVKPEDRRPVRKALDEGHKVRVRVRVEFKASTGDREVLRERFTSRP